MAEGALIAPRLGEEGEVHPNTVRITVHERAPLMRQSYDLLLLKVLSLLQDKDATLASAISASREAIWAILIDPRKFAAIG